MATLSQLFERAWGVTFYSKKSFWIMFLLLFVPQFFVFLMSYSRQIFGNISHISFVYSLIYYLLFSIFYIISIISGYFSMKYISEIFMHKRTEILPIFASWKGFFPYFGTVLCMLVYMLAVLVLFLLVVGLFIFIAIVSFGYLLNGGDSIWLVILSIVGAIISILGCIGASCVLIWATFAPSLFTSVSFFLGGKKYFDAVFYTFEITKNHWWRTFGTIALVYLIVYIMSIFGIMLFVAGVLLLMSTPLIAKVIIGIVFGGILLFAYILFIILIASLNCAIYEDYISHPIPAKSSVTKVRTTKKIPKKTTKKALPKPKTKND